MERESCYYLYKYPVCVYVCMYMYIFMHLYTHTQIQCYCSIIQKRMYEEGKLFLLFYIAIINDLYMIFFRSSRSVSRTFFPSRKTANKAKMLEKARPSPVKFTFLNLRSPWFQFTLGALVLLMEGRSVSSTHNLYYSLTMWEHTGDPVHFVLHNYLDYESLYYYDNNIREVIPHATWINKAEKEYPGYWKQNQLGAASLERGLRADLLYLKNNINQTMSTLTWQMSFGCMLHPDNTTSSYYKTAYNGKDFLAFDTVKGSWTALSVEGQNNKLEWDARNVTNKSFKTFLELGCIAWLKKYLEYLEGVSLKKNPPKARVTIRVKPDGEEVLTCRAYGFSPKEISVNWVNDRDVITAGVVYGNVTPNFDGTFYTWLRITVDPKERSNFQCRMEHEMLKKPIKVFLRKPGTSGSAIGGGIGVFLGLLLVAALFAYSRKTQKVEQEAEVTQNVEQEAEVTQNIKEEADVTSDVEPETERKQSEAQEAREAESTGKVLYDTSD
uniref:Ig-like domain-containing protein n=1 Tax=Anolis carolinensis TaxID=28377 RepID=H9G3R8_ANOCA